MSETRPASTSPHDVAGFITHWSNAAPSERANSQLFLVELCDLLSVPRPDNHPHAGYFFEFPVTEHHADGTTTNGRIDLYKRGCFVLESKQFQEARAELSQLELAAEAAGVTTTRKSSQPVRGTDAWGEAMLKARGQAERYVRALPGDENPPFIIVLDVGHSFEVFADFTQAGKAYLPFPNPRSFRIRLADLADEQIRARLRLIWTDPAALDPAKRSAEVTREVAGHLAALAKSFEQAGHSPKVVAEFLTRCLFCMFAEDVELLPKHSFTELLDSLPPSGEGFEDMLRQLFREMNAGTGKGISVVLRKKLLQFNGGLFADDTVLPINGLQLGLLKNAARQHWGSVEPAIFGTLLERALNPDERHQLGAHYTPRAYVERLVLPTIIEPLRAEWGNVRVAAITHASRSTAKTARSQELIVSSRRKQQDGNLEEAKRDFALAKEEEKSAMADLEKARAEVNAFHERLCGVTVLDPACGCGNFLYVALQHLKILEGEVLDAAAQFGENFKLELETHTIDPHQFLGIELNPRAASVAELVLWIGYLQWHFKLHGTRTPPEPILRAFKNIQCRDAVLTYDGEPQPAKDEHGQPLTIWDRQSNKTDMVTGRAVPDETKRIPLLTYTNPRPAQWPAADYIVGNPPFIGTSRMRESLGDGYAEALRAAYPDVPESADLVLYWWHKAAGLVRAGKAKRFGLITTNSLRQTFARRVVRMHLQPGSSRREEAQTESGKRDQSLVTSAATESPLSLVFAIPDHPWVDTAEGAAVRIAMTVGVAGEHPGELLEVKDEQPQDDGSERVTFTAQRGKISSDLTVGADVTSTVELKANEGLAYRGVQLIGSGFIVTPDEAKSLGLGRVRGLEQHIRPYRNGKDLTDEPREVMAIDLLGLTEAEVREKFPAVYQHLLTHVKPGRDANNRASYRDSWWILGEPRKDLRPALLGLRRFIATVETAKHRIFLFLDAAVLPDNKLVVMPLEDALALGVLSSRIHWVYSSPDAAGSLLESRPVYVKSRCFDPFPFPVCSPAQAERIRQLAEELDAHRKRAQAQHGLTLTGLYNVLEKLRANEPLTPKENLVHDSGLVSVLKQLHDDLDRAVADAYGWPWPLSDEEILTRLVALNAERAAEEARGLIRWLRPDYQLRAVAGGKEASPTLALTEAPAKPDKQPKAKPAKLPWPKTLAARALAVETALRTHAHPAPPGLLAKHFLRAKPADVQEILETLVALGKARAGKQEGTFSA